MKLFNRKKSCNCSCNCNNKTLENNTVLKDEKGIKILGTGCKKCEELKENVKKALEELDLDIPVEHITDLIQISSYGVMSTPALVIDGKVLSYGKILKPSQIKEFLK